MLEAHQAIKVVAHRTGLSAHVIRIWEKRYGAVAPERTATHRRLYSEEQLERLSLLRDLTHGGHRIGHVAKLPTEMLRKLAAESFGSSGAAAVAPTSAPAFLDDSLAAVKRLDYRGLEDTLRRAEITVGAQGLLHRVVAPLAQSIGNLWRDGTITAAHEDSPDKYTVVDTIMTQNGARTMTVDTKNHNIYTVTAEFGPTAAPTEQNPRPRPQAVPGTFTLLIYSRGKS